MATGERLATAGPDRRPPSASAAPWQDSTTLRLLVADEDPSARASVPSVVGAGVTTTVCDNGAEALWQAGRVEPALTILSATLPVVSAADVASVLWRHGGTGGAMFVSVRFGEADRAGPVLAAGASGVVSRPYRIHEIEPLLRIHLGERNRRQRASAVLIAGTLELDGPAFQVRAAGRSLHLTLREFELLRLLMLHVGGVVSPACIRREIWESRGETVTPNTIAVHVRHLRRHLHGVAEIAAVRRVGYRLTVTEDAAPAHENRSA